MSARIAVEIDAEEVKAALGELRARLGNLEPALDNLGVGLANLVRERFDRGQGPGGIPWQPSKRALKTGGKTLIDRGHLRSSITHLARGNTLEVGTNRAYAAAHQFGAVIYRYAYSGTLRLRTNAQGELLRQGEGRSANLAVFARRRHKRVRTVRYSVGNHAIIIPARPFLGMDDEMETRTLAELRNHLDVLDGAGRVA